MDSVFWEAEDCLEAALKLQPDDLKALGNLGNSLMAHGRLRLQMLRLLPPEAYAEPAEVPTAELAAGTRLEEEALSLLLLAGVRVCGRGGEAWGVHALAVATPLSSWAVPLRTGMTLLCTWAAPSIGQLPLHC